MLSLNRTASKFAELPFAIPSSLSQIEAVASAPATCGELVQGTIDGNDFLINSPIDLYARASVRRNTVDEVRIVNPGVYSKVTGAVMQLLKQSNISMLGIDIEFDAIIPRGKGLASSTSEIAAATGAVSAAIGLELSPVDMADIATSHDASDGIYFPGIARVNQLTGNLYELLGPPPPLRFIIVDTGGAIDSLGVDRKEARKHSEKNALRLRHALALVQEGVLQHDSEKVGMGATISAQIQQEILPKRGFYDLLHATREMGALGVNCAHTGTVLGVMYDPRVSDGQLLQQRVAEVFGKETILGDYRLVSGGIQ